MAKKNTYSSSGGFVKSVLWRYLLYSGGTIALLVLLWGLYLNFQVQGSLAGKLWSIPAKVYARPLELYVGNPLPKNEVIQELARLGYQNNSSLTRPGSYFSQGNQLRIYTRSFQFWDTEEPAQKIRLVFSGGEITGLQAASARTSVVRIEPYVIGGIYPEHNEDRVLISLKQVPPYFVEALLAVEDRQFFKHHGVSIKGMLRAVVVNATQGRFAQGGSTLTQQLIKNMYLSSERKLTRKLTEAYMAVLIELHYNKQEILQAYLNEVYLGQSGSRAIHGFGLASEYYFGRPFSELKLHQVAMLVAIIKGPSYYNPFHQAARVKERRNQVIDLIAQAGLVTEAQAREAKAKNLGVIRSVVESANQYPAFMDLIKRQLLRDYEEKDLRNEGLRIFTTLDPRIQEIAERAMVNTIKQLRASHGISTAPLQGAFLVTRPDNAEILAMVSDAAPRYAGFNRVLDAQRPVGSVIKPAVFLAALNDDYELNSVLKDQPMKVNAPSDTVWQPENYDKKNHGDVLLLDALVRSYNLSTAYLGLQVGLRNVIHTLEQLGIEKNIEPLPSLLLGSLELSPFEVARMYQTIAANGFSSSIRGIREVVDQQGKTLKRYPLEVHQAFGEVPIYLLQSALQQVMWRGTGTPAYQQLPSRMGFAGKTGTTDANRDSWFVGMSGNYLAVAWVGRDDNASTHLTGATGALKLWTAFMKQAQPTPLNLMMPNDVEKVWVDIRTGALSLENCLGAVQIPMRKNKIPQEYGPCVEKDAEMSGWLDSLLSGDNDENSEAVPGDSTPSSQKAPVIEPAAELQTEELAPEQMGS